MDAKLFRWINEWQGEHAVLDAIMLVFSKYMYLVAIVLCLILLLTKHRRAGLLAIGAGVIAYLFNMGISEFVQRDRPFVALEHVETLFEKEASPGFPSDSSAIVAAIAAAFGMYRRAWLLPAAAVAVLTGLSRIFAGHHYPADVAAGWAVGVVALYVIAWTSNKIRIPGRKDRGLES